MSIVTVQISGNQIDLWTNINAWNPNEKFLNNQKYSQLPNKLHDLFYNFQDDEITQLQNVTHVSIPFAYWKRGNTDCPSEANPFTKTRWQQGQNPNILGRLVIPIETAPKGYYSSAYRVEQHSKVLKNIGFTLECLHKHVLQLEGHRGRLFSTFVPLSCSSIANTITSLFPWTKITYRYDRTTPFRFAADLITLPFRLLTLLPRFFYQHVFTKSNLRFKAKAINGAGINWNSGALHLYTGSYGAGRKAKTGGGGVDPRDYINCLRTGTSNQTIYLG